MQYYFSFFITLAGLPTATESSGISFTTTLPAPMMLRSPMVTPGHTSRLLVAEVVELAASHFLKSVHIRLFVLFSHSIRRWSGRCFTWKFSNFALNPSPSGHAVASPTCTGVLSCIQQLRIMVYVLTSNE